MEQGRKDAQPPSEGFFENHKIATGIPVNLRPILVLIPLEEGKPQPFGRALITTLANFETWLGKKKFGCPPPPVPNF